MRTQVALATVAVALLPVASPGHAAGLTYYQANSPKQPVYQRCYPHACSFGEVVSHRSVATSRDGRYTAFLGRDTKTTAAGMDAPGVVVPLQLWIYDRVAKSIRLASPGVDGKPGNQGVDYNNGFGITADGRYAWYTSYSSNLVKDDRNERVDVFSFDQKTGKVTRLSVDVKGKEIASGIRGVMSADGSTVVFQTSGDVLRNGAKSFLTYAKNLRTGKAKVVVDDEGNSVVAGSNSPAFVLSTDGRYLLNTGDFMHATATTVSNVYTLFDLVKGGFQVLTGTEGAETPGVMDGAARSVVFDGPAGLTRLDLTTGAVQTQADLAPTLVQPTHPSLSADGRWLLVHAFAAGTTADAMHTAGGLYRIPLGADGKGGTPQALTPVPTPTSCVGTCSQRLFGAGVISADGRWAAFPTDAQLTGEQVQNDWDFYVVGT